MLRSLSSRIIAFGGILLAALILLASALYISSGELRDSLVWVSHSQEVMTLASEPVDLIRQMESELRAAIISNDPSLIADSPPLLSAAHRDLDRLIVLTADNPAQNARAKALQKDVLTRTAFLVGGLKLFRDGHVLSDRGPIPRARNLQAHELMLEVTRRRTDFMTAEQLLLTARSNRANRLLLWNQRLVEFGVPMVALLILLTVGVLVRAVRRHSALVVAAMEDVDLASTSRRLEPARMGSTEFARIARGYNAMTDRLEAAIQRQLASEAELQTANLALQDRSDALQSRGQVIERLGAMSHRMQAARTTDELAAVIRCFAPKILPEVAGAIYAHNNSRNCLVKVADWGASIAGPDRFDPDHCWALRLGQGHSVMRDEDDIRCEHVGGEHPYHCEPLLAGGQVIGLIHLDRAVEGEYRVRLAALAEDVSSALVNHQLQRNLREQTIRDPLTGLFNRRYLEETLKLEVARASRSETPLTVVMCDLDHFKRFNDDFGHDAGDHVLKVVTAEMRNHFREGDVLCRYGGEEFTVIAPGATLENMAGRIERLRQAVANLHIRIGPHKLGPVSMSFGLAQFAEGDTEDGDEMVQAADEALYRAKREGRNRAVIAERLAA